MALRPTPLAASNNRRRCAVTLSHVFRPSTEHDPVEKDAMYQVMAEHLGGAALEKYNAATAGSEIQEGENRWANRSQMKLETVRAAKL